MPKPKIARRCHSCGVSVRVPASFCPQCGKPVKRKPDATRDARDSKGLATDYETRELSADVSSMAPTMPLDAGDITPPPGTLPSSNSSPRKKPMQATVGMVHRADRAPREVRLQRVVNDDDGVNRVEKFRQISTAMIDEAAYDPSLRFLLVAAVLFVLFIFLLLVSELMR